ncbi:MAG: hypothetical protein JXA77_07195 [Bacteroidales bacterium]|nr:hypothetical protein [Bacteroidales bacterium]MBN2819661.1 hypothetical protein [Bacteroidales bacterium]
MRKDFDYTGYIERYVCGVMSPEEKLWFEKEIEGNQGLNREIELFKRLDDVLADQETIELKKQLEQIHCELEFAETTGTLVVQKVRRRTILSTASVVVLFVLATTFFLNRNFSNLRLLNSYYQPVEATVNVRAANIENNELAEAINYYNSKKFNEAIIIFEELLKENSSMMGLNLYSGISHLETQNYTTAHKRFQTIIDNKPNPFVESATWYLGMSYLMTNRNQEAKQRFDELASKEGYYQEQAKELLKRIK